MEQKSSPANSSQAIPPSPLWRRHLTVFILFNLLAIAFWSMPLDSPLIAAVRFVIRPYMLWTGLFQAWDTFAPQPRDVNAWVEAAVIFKDGHHSTWKFPRMNNLGLGARYVEERYRKFIENAAEPNRSPLWPDIARRVARLNDADPADPPEIVLLVRYWAAITPGKPSTAVDSKANIFFEYNVQPGDLTPVLGEPLPGARP